MPINPQITVVTVVLNAKDHIEQTIQSVINQTYPNIEYIVLDGGSTDGTLDIIKKYQDKITLWRSEPDKGIFDAMNKGIDLATSEWINFMNAGDYFYTDDVLERIFKDKQIEEDFIYGDYIDNFYIGNQVYTKIIPAPEPNKNFWKIYPCHQSSFVRTSFLKESKFNIDDDIERDKADLAKLLEFYYFKKLKFKKENIIAAYYTGGGFSAGNIFETPDFGIKFKSRWQKRKLIKKYVKNFKVDLYFVYLVLRDVIIVILLKPLPENIRYKLFAFLKSFKLN